MSWWWQPLEAAAQQQAGGPAFDPAPSTGAYQGNLEDSQPRWDQWQLLDPPHAKPDQLSPPNPPPYDPTTQCEVLYDHRDLWPWQTWQLLDEPEYRYPVPAPRTILYLTYELIRAGPGGGETRRRMRLFRGNLVEIANRVDATGNQIQLADPDTASDTVRWEAPPLAAAVTIHGPIWLNVWGSEDSAGANRGVDLIDAFSTGWFVEEVHDQHEFDVGTRTRKVIVSRSRDNPVALNPGAVINLRIDTGTTIDGASATPNLVEVSYGSPTPDVDGDTWLGFPGILQFQADPTPVELGAVWQEQPQLPWPTWNLGPDVGAEAPFQEPPEPFDPAEFDWSEQPQSPWPVWHLGPDVADYPEPPAFEPATHGFDWSEQPQLVFPPWTLGPDIPAMPLYPFHPGDGHFDWSEQPQLPWSRWADPADGSLEAPFQPPVPPFDPGTFPWLVDYGDPWAEWRSPDIREAHFAGNLASWLFTTGDPGGGAGQAPPVLIDAESGDVYLYLGGVLIAPAR